MKKAKYIILTILLFCFNIGEIFAEQVGLEYIKDASGNRVYRINNGENGDDVLKITLNVDGPNDKLGYCIDYGASLQPGHADKDQITMEEHFNKGLQNSTKASTLVKKINAYAALGYGYSNHNSDNYYLATQKLIWEAISASGFYQTNYFAGIAGKQITLTNFKLSTDVSKEENDIKKAVNNYYLTPSFCSSTNKLELGVGETKTYTDSNGVLSSYTVTCDEGLTCSNNGNVLTVTSNSAGQNQQINFSKNGNETNIYAYRANSTSQGIVSSVGSLSEVNCRFGIDSITQVQTSGIKIAYIIMIAGLLLIITYSVFLNKKFFVK